VVVALWIAFFPVLVSAVDGLGIPEELRELAAIHDASAWQRFRRIDFMYALPQIFTGMKVSITMAVGGAVVGEFIAGKSGLGYVIIEGEALVDLPSMFSAFLILALVAVVLFLIVQGIERVLLPWARYRDVS
jgi:NitT/TauT family transport system permease protein